MYCNGIYVRVSHTQTNTHMYSHTFIYLYVDEYIYIYVCVRICIKANAANTDTFTKIIEVALIQGHDHCHSLQWGAGLSRPARNV